MTNLLAQTSADAIAADAVKAAWSAAYAAWAAFGFTLLLAAFGGIRAWKKYKGEKAGTDAEANKQTFANLAREAIAVELAKQTGLTSEAVQVQKAQFEVSYKVECLFLPKGQQSALRLHITNKSLAKPVSVDYLAVQDGRGVIKPIGFQPWGDGNRIEASETKELHLPIAAVWEAGAQSDAEGKNAKLLIRCASDGGRYKWIRHIDALWYLRTASAVTRFHHEQQKIENRIARPLQNRPAFPGIPRPQIEELGEDVFGESVSGE